MKPLEEMDRDELLEAARKQRELLNQDTPALRIGGTAAIVIVLSCFSLLGSIWLKLHLINPVFAVLAILVSWGFMKMARIMRQEEIEEKEG